MNKHAAVYGLAIFLAGSIQCDWVRDENKRAKKWKALVWGQLNCFTMQSHYIKKEIEVND